MTHPNDDAGAPAAGASLAGRYESRALTYQEFVAIQTTAVQRATRSRRAAIWSAVIAGVATSAVLIALLAAAGFADLTLFLSADVASAPRDLRLHGANAALPALGLLVAGFYLACWLGLRERGRFMRAVFARSYAYRRPCEVEMTDTDVTHRTPQSTQTFALSALREIVEVGDILLLVFQDLNLIWLTGPEAKSEDFRARLQQKIPSPG